MKSILSGAIIVALLGSSSAYAQPDHRGNQQDRNWQADRKGNNGRHLGWKKDRGPQHRWNRGERMGYNDWNNAPRVNYRDHRLRKPPRGYEWRQHNNQFILVAVATGLIASIILSSGR